MTLSHHLSHRSADFNRRNPALTIGMATGLESPRAKRGKVIKGRKLSDHKFREFSRFIRLLCRARKAGEMPDRSSVIPLSYPTPEWQQLKRYQQAVIVTMAAADLYGSCAVAFSFNVDPKRLGRQKKKLQYIQQRLNKELKKRGHPTKFPIAIGLHCLKLAGFEIHCHGVAIINPNQIEAFEQAILAVGGAWRPEGHRGREMQIMVTPLEGDGLAWGRYAFFDELAQTQALLIALGDAKSNTLSITFPAREIGRHFLQDLMEFSASEIDWITAPSALTFH